MPAHLGGVEVKRRRRVLAEALAPQQISDRRSAVAIVVAWGLFALGVAHIAFGFIKYRTPLLEAVSAGFVGQFQVPEIRRTAFWFVMLGPLLMLAGHAAVHAVSVGDLALLRLIGFYAMATSLIGVVAFPKSPFWAALFLSPFLLAAGHGSL